MILKLRNLTCTESVFKKLGNCGKKDVDYVVAEGKVTIVDEFTGRLKTWI